MLGEYQLLQLQVEFGLLRLLGPLSLLDSRVVRIVRDVRVGRVVRVVRVVRG